MRSHQKAVEAWENGVFDDEVMAFPVGPDYRTTVTRDNIPRSDSSLEKLADAQAGLRSQVRNDHRRQLVTADRRCLGRDPHGGEDGGTARLRAASLHPIVGVRSTRPELATAHGAVVRHADRPRQGRIDAQRHRRRRHARGVCCADPVEHAGVCVRRVGTALARSRTRRSARSPTTSSTCTEDRSASGTRSARPAHDRSPRWPTN